jgi:hypothetical protein
VVTANLSVLAEERREEDVGTAFRLIEDTLRPVSAQVALPSSESSGRLAGVIGSVVVAAILGLTVYFAMRYLL